MPLTPLARRAGACSPRALLTSLARSAGACPPRAPLTLLARSAGACPPRAPWHGEGQALALRGKTDSDKYRELSLQKFAEAIHLPCL